MEKVQDVRSRVGRLRVIANHCETSKLRCAGVLTSATSSKPRIHLSKTHALLNEKVCISVTGLQPHQNVTLQTYVDEGRKSFGSCGHYVADREGRVNTWEDECYGGTYNGPGPFPAVLDVFGMTLVVPGHRSSLLASNGIASFSLTYVGREGLAPTPDKMDFTYFLQAFDWLSRHPSVNPNALGAIGSCIGAAYVSLVVWKRPNVRCFVSINSPTRPEGATQTMEGESVEQADPWEWQLREEREGTLTWKQMATLEDKVPTLPYWRHGAKVMQIQGEDDCAINPDILRASHQLVPQEFKSNIEWLSYPGAGHILEPPYVPLCHLTDSSTYQCRLYWGGQPRDHVRAEEDCWPRVVDFLKKNLMEGISS